MPKSFFNPKAIPPWPQEAAEAIAMQKALRHQLVIKDDFKDLKTVLGVDVSHKDDNSRAVLVLMKLKDLTPLHSIVIDAPTLFPYIPGLLSFREIPTILMAMQKLAEKPDLLMVDGQGIAHPRRLGIAAHLGVLLDIPAIGVAKSRLTGTYKEPGSERGDQSPLMDKDERIGTVLRSKPKTNALFVSPGHRISHTTSIKITMQCVTKYRLPEPTRLADKLSKQRDVKQVRLM